MATEVVTTLRDDVDGSAADRTVTFSWDGVSYEIDLSKKHIAELTSILEPYVAAGRRSGGRGAGGRSGRARAGRSGKLKTPKAAKSDVDLAEVRAWASANGHVVAPRGRVSAAVLDAFAARSGDAPRPAKAASRKRSAPAGS